MQLNELRAPTTLKLDSDFDKGICSSLNVYHACQRQFYADTIGLGGKKWWEKGYFILRSEGQRKELKAVMLFAHPSPLGTFQEATRLASMMFELFTKVCLQTFGYKICKS